MITVRGRHIRPNRVLLLLALAAAGTLAACHPAPSSQSASASPALAADASELASRRLTLGTPAAPALLVRPSAQPHAFADTAPVQAPHPFTEMLVSWNLRVPPKAGASVLVRVTPDPAGQTGWTPWLHVGEWGQGAAVPKDLPRPQRDEASGVKVDVDWLIATTPQRWVQARLVAHGLPEGQQIAADRLDFTFTDAARIPEPGEPMFIAGAPLPGHGPSQPSVGAAVPFRSQKIPQKPEIAGRICSPTSVNMVMAYRGVDQPVLATADAAFDPVNNIYGNWPRNVQAAFAAGVPGYLTRINSWAQARAYLAAGQPIITSIQTKLGELRFAPYPATGGHLIVITGMDEQGGVWVNDPAESNPAKGRIRLMQDDMTRVWLRRTAGTAYILLPAQSGATP